MARHHTAPALFRTRNEDVLGFYVSMDEFEGMEMPQTGCDLAQGAFGIKGDGDFAMSIWRLDNVGEGGGAQLERNVQEVCVGLLIVVSNDVGVIVRFLQDADLARGEGDKVLQ